MTKVRKRPGAKKKVHRSILEGRIRKTKLPDKENEKNLKHNDIENSDKKGNEKQQNNENLAKNTNKVAGKPNKNNNTIGEENKNKEENTPIKNDVVQSTSNDEKIARLIRQRIFEKKDECKTRFDEDGKILYSHLPLLFTKGKPKSLESMTQPQLEEFVVFMVLCSYGICIHQKPMHINKCPVPEWWPQGLPFKFPLEEQSVWIDRLAMLKSLVCNCYAYYECECLIKFSSDLAEMPRSKLRFQKNEADNSTSIFDEDDYMLVKCHNDNFDYDKHPKSVRYLTPKLRSRLNQTKRFEPVMIDLTFDSSSEDEKEVYFKEIPPPPPKIKKTAGDEPYQVCTRRIFYEEEREPDEVTQNLFMKKMNMIPSGMKIVEKLNLEYFDRDGKRKNMAKCFECLPISSRRGQWLLEKRRHTFNREKCLERVSRKCGPTNSEEDQVCTRASRLMRSARLKESKKKKAKPATEPEPGTDSEEKKDDYCHTYKWPKRTYKVRKPYRGPSIKPCSVKLIELSDETLRFWSRKRTVTTMTPYAWSKSKSRICDCRKIPVITLDDSDADAEYKDKSTSTRCKCVLSKVHIGPASKAKKSLVETKSTIFQEMPANSNAGLMSSATLKNTSVSESSSQESEGFEVHSESDSFNRSRNDKEVVSPVSHNARLQTGIPVNFTNASQRRPLAVVPPTPIIDREDSVDCQYTKCPPPDSVAVVKVKINFYRSIMDAIKWYTKDDLVEEPLELMSDCFTKEEVLLGSDRSQENIKPLSELTLPTSRKFVDYFQQNVNSTERDFCYKKSSAVTSKLVTRRGERHYSNREPCPSCFQGRDNYCVYEFIRQAKLAGLALHKNHKQLQSVFFKHLSAESTEA